jgi:hypothetical protein
MQKASDTTKARSRSRPSDSIALGVPRFSQPTETDKYREAYEYACESVSLRVVWVTPEWASWVLAEHNTRNREMKPSIVVQLAGAIRAGSWAVNGEPIIFSEEGVLLDGQHRLQAVVTSGVAVPCVAIFGVEQCHFASLDGTPGRKTRDILTIPRDGVDREQNTRNLAAALSWLHRWECGSINAHGGMKTLTNNEVIPLLDRHPGIRSSITAVNGRCSSGKHPAALFATLHYLFGKSNPAKRDEFFVQVLDRLNVRPGSVTAVLNRWLDNYVEGQNGQGIRGRSYTVPVAATVIKAWNIFLHGLPAPKVFKYSPEEAFPEIQ